MLGTQKKTAIYIIQLSIHWDTILNTYLKERFNVTQVLEKFIPWSAGLKTEVSKQKGMVDRGLVHGNS